MSDCIALGKQSSFQNDFISNTNIFLRSWRLGDSPNSLQKYLTSLVPSSSSILYLIKLSGDSSPAVCRRPCNPTPPSPVISSFWFPVSHRFSWLFLPSGKYNLSSSLNIFLSLFSSSVPIQFLGKEKAGRQRVNVHLLPHSSLMDYFFVNDYERAGTIIQGSHGEKYEKSGLSPYR